MRLRSFAVALAAASLIAACGSNNHPAGAPCHSSNDCAVGLACDNGACHAACNVGSDCPLGQGCVAGLCMVNAQGTCGQGGDCTTPPDACHTSVGAYCSDGACSYPHTSDPRCAESCTTAATCTHPTQCEEASGVTCTNGGCAYPFIADDTICVNGATTSACVQGVCAECRSNEDCDPRAFDLDLCSMGNCVSNKCSFTPVTNCTLQDLGTTCSANAVCKSGHCADGVCCATDCSDACSLCDATDGQCDVMPDDDVACGNIDCDELDAVCRDYHDLTSATHHRCAALGECKAANDPTGCSVFVDASVTTTCRDSTGPCDSPENCDGAGTCPGDTFIPLGGDCYGTIGDDPGVCDSGQACLQLTTYDTGFRYFLEEQSASEDRLDALSSETLTASYHDDVSTTQASTGRGLSWQTTSATSTYCASQMTGGVQVLTLEVDVALPQTSYGGSWIAGIGTNSLDTFGLAASHTAGDTTHATLTGYYNGTAVTWTVDPSAARVIVHLIFDGSQSTGGNRFQLYANGAKLTATGTLPTGGTNLIITTGSSLCIGDNPGATHLAFTGELYYAALYTGAPTTMAISEAVARLQVSDAP